MTEKNKNMIECNTCGKEIAKKAKTCPHCGAKNKSKKKGIWWKIPLAGLFLFFTIAVIIGASEFPTCDGYQAKTDVKRVFNSGPLVKQLGYKMLDIKDVEEIEYDEKLGVRRCRATALTNGGETKIRYRFTQQDDGQYWVEARESMF